ncbi:hypothetical protein SAMN04489712_12290 [Thermomonospora echinospora]|uniref:Uncharacterized protein n=1 Tax=Thermomonospora echinospora TaxID=1992 RepID=A0A1H6DU07_9ACTN|nr:hypothetical protein [Thermomonospora echinospora]SEG88837.1 hypothetical protein SAMN04489712_12290 [Thermomonospora echinospora]
MSIGPMNHTAPHGGRTARIGLWGASGSGKTSYLASLFVAVNQTQGRWNIVGVDKESVDFLAEKTDTLTRRRRFPLKTEGIQHLSWTVMGTTEQTVRERWRKRTETVPLHIQLDMIDAPGGYFKGAEEDEKAGEDLDIDIDFNDAEDASAGGGNTPEDLIDQLTECDGIIYLFDPLRENEHGDEFQHFQWALQNIVHRAAQNGTLDGMHLPHHLAVCITKLDAPKVFHTASKRGCLTVDPDDPYLFPRVRDDKVEDLFRDLGRLSPTRSALMVHDAIKASFHPGRVRYFATSAVGFYLGRRATRFRVADFQNVIPDPDERQKYAIRGDIHPINVLEPLLWLGQQTRR